MRYGPNGPRRPCRRPVAGSNRLRQAETTQGCGCAKPAGKVFRPPLRHRPQEMIRQRDMIETGSRLGMDAAVAVRYLEGDPAPAHVWEGKGTGGLEVRGDHRSGSLRSVVLLSLRSVPAHAMKDVAVTGEPLGGRQEHAVGSSVDRRGAMAEKLRSERNFVELPQDDLFGDIGAYFFAEMPHGETVRLQPLADTEVGRLVLQAEIPEVAAVGNRRAEAVEALDRLLEAGAFPVLKARFIGALDLADPEEPVRQDGKILAGGNCGVLHERAPWHSASGAPVVWTWVESLRSAHKPMLRHSASKSKEAKVTAPVIPSSAPP